MPQILVIPSNDPSLSKISGPGASASGAIELKKKRKEIEEAQRSRRARSEEMQLEIARAEANESEIERIRSQMQAVEAGPKPQVPPQQQAQDRVRRYRQVAERLSPEAAEAYLASVHQRDRQAILDQGYQQEAQELQDALSDGLFGDLSKTSPMGPAGMESRRPDLARDMASLLERNYRAGRMPGDVSERLQDLREARAAHDARMAEWQPALQQAQQMTMAMQDPGLRDEAQRGIAKASLKSVQRQTDPREFLAQMGQLMAMEDPQARQQAIADRVAAAGVVTSEAAGEHAARKKAERDLRLGQGYAPPEEGVFPSLEGGRFGQRTDFKRLAPKRKEQFKAHLKEALTPEDMIRVIQESGIDLKTLDEETVRDLVLGG